MRRLIPFLVIVLAGGTALAGEVKFTTKPTATKAGGEVKIAFAVSEKTDVEVAVLNAKGEVVRHLAGGVLGGAKAPPKPLEAGLSQALKWDMRDDFGKPAEGGPFKVRVRAGTGVKLDKFMGADPYTFGIITGLAADETGNLYIMGYGGNRNQNCRTVRVFDAEGKYLRTLMPFPADLKPGAMKDVARWDAVAKTFYARNLNSLNPEFYAGGLSLISASAENGVFFTNGGTVYKLDARGAVPEASFAIQSLWTRKEYVKNSGGGPNFLAASPDGKWLYLSGPYSNTNRYGYKFRPNNPPGRVYRVGVGQPGPMKEFVTVKVAHKEGNGGEWTKHNKRNHGIAEGPVHGLAVDAKGNVYVCDRERQRVTVFDEKGKEVGALKVGNPHRIAIHPGTGAVYVLTRHCIGYWRYNVSVVKFKGLKDGDAPLAVHKFPMSKGARPQMALVASQEKTVVYAAGVKGGLVALEDKGAKFEPVPTAFAPQAGVLDVFSRMEVDYQRDEVYVSDADCRYWRFDGETGKGGLLRSGKGTFHATDLAVGYDGLLYFQTGKSFSGPLERYTRELKPAPYPSGTHVLSKYIYGRYGIGNCEKGIGVGPDGKVYVAWMFAGWVKYAVSGWGPDGKPINGKYSDIFPKHHKTGTSAGLNKAIIGPIPQTCGGVRVDLKGDIYLGAWYWPKGQPYPKAFEKDRAWKHMTGSVVKFGPEGGKFVGSAAMMSASSVEGAKGFYTGLAPFSHPHLGTTCCVCRIPRFDVDRYGRLAIPNATGNSVRFVDNAGNLIATFGKYGNFDSQYVNPNTQAGKKGKPTLSVPEIPLTWPNCAGISHKAIYALDVYSRRVVRANLTYAVEAICPAAGGAASISRPRGESSAGSAATPPPAAPKAAGQSITKKAVAKNSGRSPKQVCTGWFSAAKNYKRIGMKTDARRCLNNIIKTYPSTQWAVRARAELARL